MMFVRNQYTKKKSRHLVPTVRYYRPNATNEGVDLLSENDELQQRDEATEPLLSTQTTQELKDRRTCFDERRRHRF